MCETARGQAGLAVNQALLSDGIDRLGTSHHFIRQDASYSIASLSAAAEENPRESPLVDLSGAFSFYGRRSQNIPSFQILYAQTVFLCSR